MGIPLKLLLIEDSADDERLLTLELQRGGYDLTMRRVQTAGAMRAALLEQEWDVIISDYTMPQFDMPSALALLQELEIDLPFIIVSGTVGEEAAVQALKSGADDFMAKDRLTRLIPSLVRAQRNADGRRERRQRERELEAIAGLASAMRQAETRAEMVPIVLNYILSLLRADGAALGLADPQTGETVIELAVAGSAQWSGRRLAPGEGMMGKVIESGLPLVANGDTQIEADPEASARACVPLVAQRSTMGALWVGRQFPIAPEEVRLLLSISDMAATAIQRLSLYEETQRRLERLTALRTIDLAINASQDMRIILGVLLAQVLAQLQIDAADLLLTNPVTQTLEYAAGRGFRLRGKPPEPARFGEGLAGRAAVERRLVRVPDLRVLGPEFLRRDELAGEGFHTYYAMPLLAKGSVNGVLEIFHRGPHLADQEWVEFLETLAGQAAITINNSALFEDLQRSNADLARAYDATIEGWSRAMDLRDRETEGHTVRVTNYTLRLAQRMGVSQADLVHIRRGALLHDMGKMGIPDSILLKPGPLTADEWKIMRQHPTYAYELLSPITHLRQALDIPHYHHEKWDGSGYPYGLERDRIPLVARIFSIVDVWDALRSNRPYRDGWPEEKVLAYLQAESGRHFDPAVVQAFMQMDLTGGTGAL
ncbi:MAG: HD domain-containing phosphohydrolase [Anaerolineales bacterium]